MTARDLAEAVRSGARSARSVLDEHLDSIAAREPEIHAFNVVLADEARAAADEVDRRVAAGEDPGPLAGVPVAVKDNMCTRGIPTTCSSRILEGWIPPYDATVVDRLAAAGFRIVEVVGSAEGGTIASQAPPADEELSPVERVVLVLEGGEPQEDEGTSADTE